MLNDLYVVSSTPATFELVVQLYCPTGFKANKLYCYNS